MSNKRVLISTVDEDLCHAFQRWLMHENIYWRGNKETAGMVRVLVIDQIMEISKTCDQLSIDYISSLAPNSTTEEVLLLPQDWNKAKEAVLDLKEPDKMYTEEEVISMMNGYALQKQLPHIGSYSAKDYLKSRKIR